MKISWNWLNEVLPVPVSIEETTALLTDIGLEVEGVDAYESIRGGLRGLLTGEVMNSEKHPDADKLKCTQVDIGTGTLLNIVCGAPNVAVGQKVIVAIEGTTIHPVQGEPFSIKKTKIRGVVSEGMLCADDEIGLGTSHEGLRILPVDTPVGIPVAELFHVYTDHIIEIGLTANHADANSHLGVARELAAALKVRKGISAEIHVPPALPLTVNTKASGFSVEIVDAACKRYAGIIIQDIRIGASPASLQEKLRAIGMRPVNNVVDITNYILHLFGQPLHAFDASKIHDRRILVNKLPAGTPFVTLDARQRKLFADDLMISDAHGGLCIAGVYGGIESGVTDVTTDIFLESAYFDPAHIRRTESAHGLKTDASSRFARGTDIDMVIPALCTAAGMILEYCGGKISGDVIDNYPEVLSPYRVDLRMPKLHALSATDIPVSAVQTILESLQIRIIGKTGTTLHTEVPRYKLDVTREIDLVEEILRMYGFNNIPLPENVRTPYLVTPKPDREKIRLETVGYLAAQGWYEIATNAISRSKYYQEFLPELANARVQLINSLNSELDCMRQTLAFTGLEVLAYNINHKQNNLRMFEFGRSYFMEQSVPVEHECLALYCSGNATSGNWRTPARAMDFFDMKEMVGRVCDRMGIDLKEATVAHKLSAIFSSHTVIGEKDQVCGIFGQLKDNVLHAFGIRQPVYFGELYWTPLLEAGANRKVKFQEINKYPEMRRDLALVVDQKVQFSELEHIARQGGKEILREVILFDVYEGAQLKGRKSYALGLTFSSTERTLTDAEVDTIIQGLIKKYEQELQAEIRK